MQRALALHRQGNLADAERICVTVLQRQPTHVLALHLAGVIALQTGRLDRGIALLGQVVQLAPEAAEAHRDFGGGLLAANRFEAALASFDKAIALKPDLAEALYNRGLTLAHLRRYKEALADYDKAIALHPEQAILHTSRAATLNYLRRYGEALAAYDAAIALLPNYAEAHSNRGLVLSNLLRYEDALASCDRAIALRPDYADAHADLGLVLSRLQRHSEALASYDRAIALNPNLAKAHADRGVVLADLHRHAEALASMDRAIAVSPGHADAHRYLGLCALALGDYERGWLLYERRQHRANPLGKPASEPPPWLGEASIAGKTLFIHWEQGLGDTIQFCRYAKLAVARGARVAMSVQAPLRRLLTTLEAGIAIIGEHDVPSSFDYHCPMLSLPLAFDTKLESIPDLTPYLSADPAAVAMWRNRLAGLPGLRVGLCWAGNARSDHPSAHATDLRRSITLANYAPLAAIGGASFVSLQKGEPASQAATPPPGLSLHDWTNELVDFADTAALIEALDLVITVDTSVAHLAGALGKPVWILSRYDACWRWLIDRNDSPWYSTARLWHQPAPGDWDSIITRVAAALRDEVALRPTATSVPDRDRA